MDEIDLTHSIIRRREDGILELHASDNHVYSIPDVRANVEAFGKLTHYKKAPVLIIGGSFSSLDNKTRSFMASEESLKYSSAEAFLITSLPQKILINFYIQFDKPLIPTKLFTNREKAEQWLKEFL